MPEIIVNINDQDYAIVCDPGEENHLKQLSSRIDFKVRELTKRFGKIGETRLMVMASLLIADEIHDLNQKLKILTYIFSPYQFLGKYHPTRSMIK